MIQLATWGAVFAVAFLATSDPRAAFVALALCMLAERCFGLRREAAASDIRLVQAGVEPTHDAYALKSRRPGS